MMKGSIVKFFDWHDIRSWLGIAFPDQIGSCSVELVGQVGHCCSSAKLSKIPAKTNEIRVANRPQLIQANDCFKEGLSWLILVLWALLTQSDENQLKINLFVNFVLWWGKLSKFESFLKYCFPVVFPGKKNNFLHYILYCYYMIHTWVLHYSNRSK